MPILSLPTLERSKPTVVSFSLIPNTQKFESPLNRTTQTLELPGARWAAKMEYKNRSEADGRVLKAFLASLRGMSGRFYLSDLSHPTPSGTALGTPLVKGAGQTGTSLNIDGCTINQTAFLKAGDYFGVNGELKIVTATVPTDGSGNATIPFEPPIRTSPADNAVITLTNPVCTMRLVDDNQDQVEFDPERRPTITINCVEVFA